MAGLLVGSQGCGQALLDSAASNSIAKFQLRAGRQYAAAIGRQLAGLLGPGAPGEARPHSHRSPLQRVLS